MHYYATEVRTAVPVNGAVLPVKELEATVQVPLGVRESEALTVTGSAPVAGIAVVKSGKTALPSEAWEAVPVESARTTVTALATEEAAAVSELTYSTVRVMTSRGLYSVLSKENEVKARLMRISCGYAEYSLCRIPPSRLYAWRRRWTPSPRPS